MAQSDGDARGLHVANFLGRNMYAHVTTNVTLTEIDADTVHGHGKFLGFPNDGMPVTGDYHDEIVRTVDGWRLRHRRAEIRQRSSSTDCGAVAATRAAARRGDGGSSADFATVHTVPGSSRASGMIVRSGRNDPGRA